MSNPCCIASPALPALCTFEPPPAKGLAAGRWARWWRRMGWGLRRWLAARPRSHGVQLLKADQLSAHQRRDLGLIDHSHAALEHQRALAHWERVRSDPLGRPWM